VLIKALYVTLIVCTLALVGVAVAAYWRYRRHMKASDEALRGALDQMEQERKLGP
jgi:hypothetical protein